MTSHDINIALSYLDEGLLEEHFIYKEKLKRRERAIKSIVRFAPIAACICIVFAATALLLPKLAREPAPPTPEGQIQMGIIDGTTEADNNNTIIETDSSNVTVDYSTSATEEISSEIQYDTISPPKENVTDEDETNITLPPVTSIEGGFSGSSAAMSNLIFCAYKSDTNIFDIDNVTLDFYFGYAFYNRGVDYFLQTESYPTFKLGFDTENHDIIFVEEINENLVSEKYGCNLIFSEDNHRIIGIEYNHSETLTIPKELFTQESGIIYFQIYAANQAKNEDTEKCIEGKGIKYQVVGDKVILTSGIYY